MKRIDVIKELERELEDYFINDIEKEWIDLRIVNVTGVDLTVVSEKGENIKECYNKIEDIFLEINSKIDKEDEKLFIRKKRIYSVYEAEIFEVDKPIRVKKKGFTFGELVDNLNFNKDTNIENKKHKSKVVSFYSYKGGVGRTVILIQTAYLLASKGKRVAIIDLDIEAPSFNDIFENDISNNNGMINYLYNKLYNIKSEEDESIVKFVSKLNTNVSGEVYVIPAGKISLKYIKMLELLKEKRIYENEYISEFIEELEKQYNVDYVLIDSRTGLNNWGALSISNISDELFLCAYPNKENVRGINMISELINDNKKYNVIFSRIDNSDEGEKKAKELFDQLKINQDFIGIFYEKRIALENKYPIESINNGFEKISNYLLEDEIIRENKKLLKANYDKSEKILDKIMNRENFDNIYTSSELKILDFSNSMLIKDENIIVEKMIETFCENKNYFSINDLKFDFFKITDIDLDKIIDKLYEEILLKTVEIIEKYTKIKFIKEKLQICLKRIKDLEEKMDDKKEFNNMVTNLETNELEEVFADIPEVYYCIIDYNKIVNNCSAKINYDELKVYLGIWSLVINHLNLMQKKISYKFIFNSNNIKEIEFIKERSNSNILDLTWSNKNYSFVKDNTKEVLNKIVQNLDELDDIIKNEDVSTFKESNMINLSQSLDRLNNINNINDFKYYEDDLNKKRRLVFGNRTNNLKYSKPLSEWIANEIIKSTNLSKKLLLDILSEAALIEKSNNDEKDSIITFNSLKKASHKLTRN